MTTDSHDHDEDWRRHDHEAVRPHDDDPMPTCYIHRATRTIADLMKVDWDNDPQLARGTWILTRINVPERHRRNGHGQDILNRILADADANEITLALQPLATGEMPQEILEEWYWRNGFDWDGKYMVRPPKNPSRNFRLSPP